MDAAAAAEKKFIDVTSVKVVDLRSLGQDEVQSLATLYGGMPAGLQEVVDVIRDKSIFNESASSRRQTFDRHRLPRNKDRHLFAGSASARLHVLAIESAGRSHKDLILHFYRQLHIGEKGDKALYPPHPRNDGTNLKKMARVSLTAGIGDHSVRGGEALQRPTKQIKTKIKAPKETHPFLAVKMISSAHVEHTNLKDRANTFMMRSSMASSKGCEGKKLKITPKLEKAENDMNGKNLHCICGKTYATPFTLRRHAVATCMVRNKTSRPTVDGWQEPATNVMEEKCLEEDKTKHLWNDNVNQFKCRHCLKRFIRKRYYLCHIQKHTKQAKKKVRPAKLKKMGRPPSNLMAENADLKVEKRNGRPGKLDGVANLDQGRRKNNKRKGGELDGPSDSRRVRSRITRQTVGKKVLQTFICEECGELFDEFSSYSGHLINIHNSNSWRLREVYVGEAANAAVDINNVNEWSALGFRRLLINETTGSHLPGLPAQLLFSGMP